MFYYDTRLAWIATALTALRGVLIVSVLSNGMVLMGVPPSVQIGLQGLMIIGAVALYLHNKQGDDVARLAVLVALEGAGDQAQLAEVARRIALHVAGTPTPPLALNSDELDPEESAIDVVGPKEARTSTLRKEVNHLKRVLAEKTLEVDFFKSALQKIEARRQQSRESGAKASTSKSRK